VMRHRYLRALAAPLGRFRSTAPVASSSVDDVPVLILS
jgi:hypothetical protein